MSRACATLSDFNFSGDDSSSEDEKVKRKQGDFTGHCLMGKSSRSIPNTDSDVTDNLSFESLSLRIAELENALCNQDKLLCRVFRQNKKLNLELENSFSKIASLRSVNDNMSAKPCDSYNMIMVNYAYLWLMHSQVVSQLKGAKLELRELKACSLLLVAYTSCHLLRCDLEVYAVEIKNLKRQIDYSSRYSAVEIKNLKCQIDRSSRYSVLSPPCDVCGSLKGKLFHTTKENTKLKREVAYLSAHLEKTWLSEKIIEDDLSQVEYSATKSTYKLGVGFEKCENKGKKSAPKFIPSSNYHKEEEALKPTKTHYPSNLKPSFNPKRAVRKETPKLRDKAFVSMFYDHASHLDDFCFRRMRIEKRLFE
jgi:hypothetical protein